MCVCVSLGGRWGGNNRSRWEEPSASPNAAFPPPLPPAPKQITAKCAVTGSGGQATTACWRAQLAECGHSPCDTGQLPAYNSSGPTTYAPGEPASQLSATASQPLSSAASLFGYCVLSNAVCCCSRPAPCTSAVPAPAPRLRAASCQPSSQSRAACLRRLAASAANVTYGGAPPTYSSTYQFSVNDAWKQANTHYCESCLAGGLLGTGDAGGSASAEPAGPRGSQCAGEQQGGPERLHTPQRPASSPSPSFLQISNATTYAVGQLSCVLATASWW